MSVLYHIAPREAWKSALQAGCYVPESLHSEGFVHLSSAHQYAEVANRLFAGRRDLVLLFVDTQRLAAPLRYERALPEGPRYPHLYGALELDAVFDVVDYEPGAQGRFEVHMASCALAAREGEGLEEVARRALEVMAGFPGPWWVAGGWALDLFLAAQTRPHADLEISVLAADQQALYEQLDGWELRLAGGPQGHFPPWHGEAVRSPYHQLWARPGAGGATTPEAFVRDPAMLEFLLEAGDHRMWRYRRQHDVSRPLTELGDLRQGVPFLRPEIALLFKAKAMRFKDERDFERVLPRLDTTARRWLHDALAQAHPGHPWRQRLSQVAR